MTQEYLFINEKYKKEIESFTVSDKVQKKIKIIENSSCWTLSLNIDGENEEIAKLLDSLNIQICQNYKPTVLSNGCSAYFNKSLYPIVNEFERKLRKLLYLASALQGDNDSYKVINDIESKDLGEIFEALFSDSDFVKKVKEQINKKTWNFTRDELIACIESLKENTLWDTLLGTERVKTLRKKFNELRNYRNDVMHAHNINLNQFKLAKRLFQKVNAELDIAIRELIGAKEENEPTTPVDFNRKLSSALMSLQDYSSIDDLSSKLNSTIMSLQNRPEAKLYSEIEKLNNKIQSAFSPELIKTLSAIENIENYISNPQYIKAISNWEKIIALQNNIASASNTVQKNMEDN